MLIKFGISTISAPPVSLGVHLWFPKLRFPSFDYYRNVSLRGSYLDGKTEYSHYRQADRPTRTGEIR